MRRPWAVLGVWLVAIVALAVVGLNVSDRLTSAILTAKGTESAEAQDVKAERFDEEQIFVLLDGPRRELERQGPRLAARLAREPGLHVVAPWSGGSAVRNLRPRPDAAGVVLSVKRRPGEAAVDFVPRTERLVRENVREPVEAHLASGHYIGHAAVDAAVEAAAEAEKIALPVLVVVLFLVFGSPLAASIPGVMGLTTVAAGYGILWLLTHLFRLDPLAASLSAMMGLALGVDYSLLLVSRFREELGRGLEPAEAAQSARSTAGRTVAFAGVALIVAMAVAAVLAPGDVLLSGAVAVIIADVLSLVGALAIAPAALTLIGRNIDRWSIYRRGRREGRGVPAVARGALGRPFLAAALILTLLLAGSAVAFALDTGTPSAELLPPDSRAREDVERVAERMGPGWTTPFEIVVDDRRRPLTRERSLTALARFQERIERDPGVAAVAGLAPIERRSEPLRTLPTRLKQLRRTLRTANEDRAQLTSALGRAGSGASQLQVGLQTGAQAAYALRSGSGEATQGAAVLAQALQTAARGSQELLSALREAQVGTDRLIEGSSVASEGAGALVAGLETARTDVPKIPEATAELSEGLHTGARDLERLQEPVGQATDRLERAMEELEGMTVGQADPRYPAARRAVAEAYGAVTGRNPEDGSQVDPEYPGLAAALDEAVRGMRKAADGADRLTAETRKLAEGVDRLYEGAARLDGGLRELTSGLERLGGGLEQIAAGGARLAPGIARLGREAPRLEQGLEQLTEGSGRLAGGLDKGGDQAGLLVTGIDRIRTSVERSGAELPGSTRDLDRLQRQSPGAFRSGYFWLAGVDGARPRQRNSAGVVLNIEGGGHTARTVVVPKTGLRSEQTADLRRRLERWSDRLADRTGAHVLVGGPAAFLEDYNDHTQSRLPLVTFALALVTFLVLVPILRSIFLPLVAVLLNVVTVGMTFGVMSLLFNDATLGGPGYTDAVTAAGIITVIFGLSIDYEVFILTRVREEHLAGADNRRAIFRGLAATAGVVTGAAAIMIAVFSAFATSDFFSIRQFGVGLALAVAIDAFLIRLLALPALMLLLGRWNWWMPAWLDRALPRVDIEAPPRTEARPEASRA